MLGFEYKCNNVLDLQFIARFINNNIKTNVIDLFMSYLCSICDLFRTLAFFFLFFFLEQ